MNIPHVMRDIHGAVGELREGENEKGGGAEARSKLDGAKEFEVKVINDKEMEQLVN
ncbi:MAG: hypothetical protein WCA76_23220 [Candidatus Sulfotelmatobacter sp.]|jgi:hypothetical protein